MLITPQKIIDIKKNIFPRSQLAITDYNNFKWHKTKGEADADKVNSSQALAIDFWGCLKTSPEKDIIINYLFKKNCRDWDIIFEYTNIALLNEPKSTQIDALLECDTDAIMIESKFAEQDGGKCSQPELTKRKVVQCNGNYEDQINPVNNIKSKCALTGKKIYYWNYIDSLTTYKSTIDYKPCPFKGGTYQWMRNICFAEAYSQQYLKNTECYLVYYESYKCPIALKVSNGTYLGNLKGKLLNPIAMQVKSYNCLLIDIINYSNISPSEQKVWIDLQDWMIGKESRL